jgi:rfaE bifunctional protein nucleotidyltransferase chain/domain
MSASSVRRPESKILSRESMVAERARLSAAGRRLVFTNGCFDILHPGHVDYLLFARNQGDALVVGVNSDSSVNRSKGRGRPIVPERDRALVLAGLESVDYVVIFEEDEPAKLVGELLPDILVKGEDWKHYVSGREAVESAGGRVVLAPLVPGRSTTDIIGRILGGASGKKGPE